MFCPLGHLSKTMPLDASSKDKHEKTSQHQAKPGLQQDPWQVVIPNHLNTLSNVLWSMDARTQELDKQTWTNRTGWGLIASDILCFSAWGRSYVVWASCRLTEALQLLQPSATSLVSVRTWSPPSRRSRRWAAPGLELLQTAGPRQTARRSKKVVFSKGMFYFTCVFFSLYGCHFCPRDNTPFLTTLTNVTDIFQDHCFFDIKMMTGKSVLFLWNCSAGGPQLSPRLLSP